MKLVGYLTTFPNNSMERIQQCKLLNVRNKEEFMQISRVDILKNILGRLLDFVEIATWPILFEEHCPRQADDSATVNRNVYVSRPTSKSRSSDSLAAAL
ncbi:hypothetical protein Taro_044775 [Colocasia esculenta]|uniref:Uncharacterized protein n=1 Tax=Colocasia esculenta TaxID=4460 RepID=A0A843X397_COLES|nr:hypothetical protein [Colocasia esculenta]